MKQWSACWRLLVAHAGLAQRRGPLGKTQLAKLMAEFLSGSEADMIRLDMSEYMEEHSAAKLIGSPPGYVGHEEEGQLTGRLRTKPYSVVLLQRPLGEPSLPRRTYSCRSSMRAASPMQRAEPRTRGTPSSL